jgi:hypothetical protein
VCQSLQFKEKQCKYSTIKPSQPDYLRPEAPK